MVSAKNIDCVRLLAAQGGDLHFISNTGEHLLSNAVARNDVSFVKELLELGINPDLNSACETALHTAISSDYFAAAKLLLEAGANPNQQDVDGWSTLHQCNSRKAIDFMLKHGADPSLGDCMGSTAEETFERMGRPDLASHLRGKTSV